LFFGFLDPEDSGIKVLCNVCGILVINMLSRHRRLGSSSIQIWEPQSSE